MKITSFPILLISAFLSLFAIDVHAGICDISGSGIGGTGAPTSKNNGSGLGGTGAPSPKKNGSGIGGTGAIANGSGIGGTGAIANDSGIGGTGQKTDNQASIIIGTITGFGSICVNGVEIHYATSTPIQVNGEQANTDQLALGQVVSVNVSGSGTEVYANDIQVMNIVAGPITEIDHQLNRLTVLGQKIQLSAKTHFANNFVKTESLHKGHFIQISGLRQANGEVVATRIDNIPSQHNAQLSGIATNINPHGFMLNGVSIKTKENITIVEGQKVNVSGQFEADKIIANQITIPSLASGQSFKIEGLVNFDTKEDHIKIGNIEVHTTDQLKDLLSTLPKNQSVIISGTMDAEHEVEVDHVFIKDFIEKTEIEHIHQPHHNEPKNHGTHDDEFDKNDHDEQKHDEDDSKFEKPEFKILGNEDDEEHAPEIKEPKLPEVEDSHELPESDSSSEPPEIEEPTEHSEIEDSPEISEIEEPPEMPEIEEPPEMPEIEEPPEIPEIEEPPEMPEIEEPPEIPEIEEPPEMPEIEEPPEIPEIEEPPELPEIEEPPELPEIEEPPELPEIEEPETPEIEDYD